MRQNDIFKNIENFSADKRSRIVVENFTQEQKEKQYKKISAEIEKMVEAISKQQNYTDEQKEFYFIFFKQMDTILYEFLKREE